MRLNPLQDFNLIFEPVVRTSTFQDLRPREEPVRTDSIVEVNHHDTSSGRLNQPSPVEVGIRVCIKASALDKHKDRQL